MTWLYLTLPFVLLAVLVFVWRWRRPKESSGSSLSRDQLPPRPRPAAPPLTARREAAPAPRFDPDAAAVEAARAKLAGRVGQAKADDLIAGVKKLNSDRDARWCAEKALWDYERDRS